MVVSYKTRISCFCYLTFVKTRILGILARLNPVNFNRQPSFPKHAYQHTSRLNSFLSFCEASGETPSVLSVIWTGEPGPYSVDSRPLPITGELDNGVCTGGATAPSRRSPAVTGADDRHAPASPGQGSASGAPRPANGLPTNPCRRRRRCRCCCRRRSTVLSDWYLGSSPD